MALRFKSGLIVLVFITLGGARFGRAQTPASSSAPETQAPRGGTSACEVPPNPQLSGSIRGTVVDESGALVAGAQVRLTGDASSLAQEVVSGQDGQFCFPNIAPGSFQLSITWPGFAPQTFSGTLKSGEIETAPEIVLKVSAEYTDVVVGLTPTEVAEEQIKLQEKQRVLGVIPNFYVSYIPDAAPLNSKQKFELAWKTVVDPVTFGLVGAIAGVQQAQDHFAEYGQGVEGYAKRYGAGYADTLTGTFLGGALLPSLLKQDPRYFYKGTGSIPSRIRYALVMSVVCKGDNGNWQVNYSGILGGLAAGAISNLYYPPQDRDGVQLTFENAAIGIGGGAATNLFQEFLIRKLTPRHTNHTATSSANPKP
jgi:Carboxypeptidase regulatory-like domain